MRILKIVGYAIGALLALIILTVTFVVLFVDPNDYRDDIAAAVESRTGRKLTLSGDLKLSVFPWVALETGAATLSERQGFGDEPFVSIDGARVSVRLLPLLRGRLEVGKVRLDGARIRLITDEQGRDNWADLGERGETQTETTTGTGELPTIAGLEITNSAVTMENRQDKSRRVVRDFNLETGRLVSGEPFDLKAGFVLDQDASLSLKVHVTTTVTADLKANTHRLADPEIDITVLGQGYPPEGIPVQVRARSLSADIGRGVHQLDGLTVAATWKGDGFPPAGVPVSVQAQQLTANLEAQTFELTEFAADIAGAKLSGGLTGQEILDAPRITGPLRLEQVSPREWLPKLGIDLPATTDPAVFGRLSFAGNVVAAKDSAGLEDVQLTLDDTTAKGSVGVANFETNALRFDLDVDRIDADRYLAPKPAEPTEKEKAGKSPPMDIPIDTLRTLNARGQLRVGEAIFAGITFSKLRLGVNARDGKVRLNPTEASMYGGTYVGDVGIDATGETARIDFDERVSGVAFAPMLEDVLESKRFSGTGNMTFKGSATGRNTDDLMRTIDGKLDFNVADGALEGTDLWYEIRRARAVLKQEAVPERSGPARTTFESLRGSGMFEDGVLSTNDLDASMQYLKVTGKGTFDLPKSALDYQLMATVLKIPAEGTEASQMQDMVDAEIPVKVTGTLDDPKVRPDITGYAKGRVKEELKKQEEKLKEKLGDKLKDLFSR